MDFARKLAKQVREKEMLRKKHISLALLVSLVMIFTIGCSTSDKSQKEESNAPQPTVEESVPEKEMLEEEMATEEETKDESENVNDSKEAFEQQTLLDQDGIVITAIKMVEDELWGNGIKLLIENNTDRNIGVSLNELIVNDYMIDDLFVASVASGKKANETLYLDEDDLERAGIDTIGQIEFYFHIYDATSYDTMFDADGVTLKTNAFDQMEVNVVDEGFELLNEQGIRIVYKYVTEDDFGDQDIVLFVENKSGRNLSVTCDDVSINGFMVTTLFSTTVYDGKMALDEITLFSDDLEENGIENLEEVELMFSIYDPESYDTVYESGMIQFNME